MTEFPSIVREQGSIQVLLDEAGKSVAEFRIEFVLDIDRFGEVIGIEIMDLVAHAGEHCLQVIQNSNTSYSYNEDADAFYLRLNEGASLDQKVVDGKLLVDKGGQIIGFRAPTTD
jgi:uncharacterized protein YuzE